MTDEPGTGAEPAAAPEPTDRRARTVPAGALVLAVMVAAALGILAVVALAMDGDDGSGTSSELDQARFAAGRFAERFLTFEDDGLDAWREDIRALSTAGFAEEVDEVQEGLRRLISDAELDATAEVTDIFVSEIERGAVGAVVVYDRQLTSASGARDETDRYMQLDLLRVDGEWLVDNVIDIATAGAAGTNPAAPAPEDGATTDTTSTTAPPGTSAPGSDASTTSTPG